MINTASEGHEKKPETWLSKLGTDALFLAAMSAIGYCVAFAYEVGYAKHFGYPTYLIAPTPNVIVTAVAAVLVVVGGLLPPLIDIFDSGNPESRKFGLYLVLVLYIILSGAYLFVMSNYDFWSLTGLAAAAVILFAMYWAGKHDAKQGRTSSPKSRSVGGIIFLTSIIYTVSTLFGVLSAKNQRQFYFLKQRPDFAVVRLYDSTAISVKYDIQKKEFQREYSAIKFGDDLKELALVRVTLKEDRKPVAKDD